MNGPPKDEISFVCCIEAGGLEDQTIRMAESLRRHAGRLGHVPLFAVTPRFGPCLTRATRRAMQRLNVTHLECPSIAEFEWFGFLNKPLALCAAEPFITTPTIGFLDSDLLFVAEPSLLLLTPSEDFAGFPVETKEVGTAGPGDTFETLWKRSCAIVGVDLDALPYCRAAQTGELVRLYFNSGIFTYRKNRGFSESYLTMCMALLESNIHSDQPGYTDGFKEMGSVGFSVIKLGLQWRALPYSHDYVMFSKTHDRWYRREDLRDSVVIHYHDAMWPHFWDTFLGCLKDTHPDVAVWLEPLGPMSNVSNLGNRVLAKALWIRRKRAATSYKQQRIAV